MTLHDAEKPARAFEDAARAARATSHSRRLDTAVQAALNAYADALTALTNYLRVRDAENADLRRRVTAVEEMESRRAHSDS
jgi:hypothetical protein